MRILIVDDSNDKLANIATFISSNSSEFFIDSVFDSIAAQRKLLETKYDLLITDLVLPLRESDTADQSGGQNLVKEIDRNKKIKSPSYILGLTQYQDLSNDFSLIWKAITYSATDDNWKLPLLSLLNHIKRSSSPSTAAEIKPALFLEGKADERLLTEAIKIFSPNLLDSINPKSDKSAGASWVARQIIVWAHSLHKDANEDYVRAVGLLDGDGPGKDAANEINRIVQVNSASSQTFKIIKLSPTYARHLIPLSQKGVNIPVCLEEMIPPKYWHEAKSRNWLELRKDPDSYLADPKNWDKYQFSFKEYLTGLGLNSDEEIYTYKMKDDFKEKFHKMISDLPATERKEALSCFEKLIKDIADSLLLKDFKGE